MKNNYLILLFLICLIFFLPFLINPDFLVTRDNDLGRTYIPLFSFIRESFFTYKEIPLWRSEQLMGESLIGNPLSSLFYPGNLFFLIFPVNLAAIVYLIGHFIIAAVSTFLLARSFKLSQSSSFAAACFYAFSTKILLHVSAGHLTMIAAFSYFPLAFLAVRKLIITRGKPINLKWLIVGSVALSFSYMTYPTIFYYSAPFLLVYLLYRLSDVLISTKKILLLFFLLITTFGLMALTFFPQLEFAHLSTRSQLKLEDVALPLWNFKRFVTSLVFPYINFASFDHESFLYLGFVPSLLAIIGFTRLSSAQKVFLAIVGILALFFVAGLSTPFFELAYKYLPFLKYSRITTRLWFAVTLVVALLAAYGLEKIRVKGLVFLIVGLFLIESFYIGYRKIAAIPYLSFKNEELYRFLASDQDLFRVYCTTYCFNSQLASKYKIQVLHGESPIQDAKFVRFLESAGNYQHDKFAVIFPPYQVWQKEKPPAPNSYLLGLANVKYVASTYQLTDRDFNLSNKFDDVYLYENQLYQPRFHFEDSEDQIDVELLSPNRMVLKFPKIISAKNLIISENFYPDWFTYANNQKFKIEPYLSVFRKVILPVNTNRVEMKYEPQSLKTGKIITLATIFVLLMYFCYSRRIKQHD